MTISSSTNKVSYTGNGVTINFAFPFLIFDDDDLLVVFRNITTLVETVKAKTTDYIVTGVGDPDGGVVVFVSGHQPSSTEKVFIVRTVVPTQEVALPLNNPFPSTTIEFALDKLTALAQQLSEQITRSILLPITSSLSGLSIPEPVAKTFLRWNDLGDKIVNGGTADQIENAESYAEIAQNAANNLTCNRYEETVAGADKSAFTLPFNIAPSNANIAVIINGVWQAASAYTIVDATHVTLSVAVPAGTNVNFISMNIPGLSSIQSKMDQPTSKVPGNLVNMDANGNGVDSGDTVIGVKSGRKNFIINGCFRVAQRAVPNISGSMQYGKADRWTGILTNATGGTVNHSAVTTSLTGCGLFLANISCSAGGALGMDQKIEAQNSIYLNGKTVTFNCKVWHDFGSATNFKIYIYKPTSTADDFSSCTEITSSSNISCASSAWTTLTFTFTLGASDASLGLRVQVFSTGLTLSNKNVYLAEAQLEIGSVATPFEYRPFAEELALCQRYYEKSFNLSVAPAQNIGIYAGVYALVVLAAAIAQYGHSYTFSVRKRVAPNMVTYNPGAANAQMRNSAGGDCSSTSIHFLSERGFGMYCLNPAGSTQGSYSAAHWTAEAEL